MEKEIKQSDNEKFLNSIIENIPDMIFVKDAKELRFVRFNKAGEDLLGYSKEEMIGKNDYDFFPKKEADAFTSDDRKVLDGKVVVDVGEQPIQTKNKGIRILKSKKIPILDENGVPVYLLGISEDITEKKEAQKLTEEKIKQIEEINKMMVGRELKMSQLKAEIEKLKKK
jgi:PAS domain S-box-containing protein